MLRSRKPFLRYLELWLLPRVFCDVEKVLMQAIFGGKILLHIVSSWIYNHAP